MQMFLVLIGQKVHQVFTSVLHQILELLVLKYQGRVENKKIKRKEKKYFKKNI